MAGVAAPVALGLALLVSMPLHAQSPPPGPPPAEAPIARWELPATIAGLATAFAASALIAPGGCRWCESTAAGADAVNRLDRSTRDALRWSDANVGTAGTLSSITLYAPLALALVHRDLDRRGLLTVAEALATTSLITEVVKVAVARERPSYHYRPAGSVDGSRGRNESFVSGHTAEAFAVLVSAARETAARGRPTRWLWIAGVPLATATGYLRIGADRHYLTDVLSGAALGVAVGYGVPALHERRSARRPVIMPSAVAHGGQVVATWTW